MAEFGIYALVGDPQRLQVAKVRREISGVTGNRRALAFPVHITIKGRFDAAEWQADAVMEALRGALPMEAISVEFGSPKLIPSGILWLPVRRRSRGFKALRGLHEIAAQHIGARGYRDRVPEEWQRSGFLPHVTLAWGVRTKDPAKCASSTAYPGCALLDRVALVRYPTQLARGSRVRVVRSFELRNPSRARLARR